MTNKFTSLALLMRLNSPTVYFCYFFPAAFGLLLAYQSNPLNMLYLLFLFAVGSVITRGAGCIINDIYDRNLDKKVARTKNRPIASGAISVKEALTLLLILLFVGLLILISLNFTSIIIGFVAVVNIINKNVHAKLCE